MVDGATCEFAVLASRILPTSPALSVSFRMSSLSLPVASVLKKETERRCQSTEAALSLSFGVDPYS